MKTASTRQLHVMADGGSKLGSILSSLMDLSEVGVNLMDLEQKAQDLIKKFGGTPSFVTVPGYHWATCLCVNEEVVHGIPKNYFLKDGDVLTIDIGMLYGGFHTDTAWTKIIGQNKPFQTAKFLEVGQTALNEAIRSAKPGNHIGDISKAIEDIITSSGYSVVKSLVGHGVGENLHQDPQIPGFLSTEVNKTPILHSGMTLAIEVIYAMGKGSTIVDGDGWTIKTRDHSLSAVFEHTVGINDTKAEVLTKNIF